MSFSKFQNAVLYVLFIPWLILISIGATFVVLLFTPRSNSAQSSSHHPARTSAE